MIVHICDHHVKNHHSHDNIINEEKLIKTSVASDENDHSNDGHDDSNDENDLDKSKTLHNTNFLDDIQHTNYKNLTVLYLAGYDDEIFKLRNDLLEMGEGDELIVYFFLYYDHKYYNIGNVHTKKIYLKETLLKYAHYYYIDLETAKNNNFNKQGIEDSEENVPDEVNIENGSQYLTVHPEKESDGSYKFIIPKEKDMIMKDIMINLNKNIDAKKMNKPSHSTTNISPLSNEPNDDENFYVDKDFLSPCTHGNYLYKKYEKNNKNKKQVLKSQIQITPPFELESEIEDNLNKENKSTLSNKKKVLYNYGKVEQTIENLPTPSSVINHYKEEKGDPTKKIIYSKLTSTANSGKSKDTGKTGVLQIFKGKTSKNVQNHKDITYYNNPKTLNLYNKTIANQDNLYKNPFRDVDAKELNIVAPITFRGHNRVRPNYSQYYLKNKPSNDILFNVEYNKPNDRTFSHIQATNQYSANKKIPYRAMSKYTDLLPQIENTPFYNFKPLPHFSDESYLGKDKMSDPNISYDNKYISNPNDVTYKQNMRPLQNYRIKNPVADFSTDNVIKPAISSPSNIKHNDVMPMQWNIVDKQKSYLPKAFSLYQGNRASQRQRYGPDKTLIQAPSILRIPCQEQRADKSRILAADGKNTLDNYESRPRGVSLVNANSKLSSNAQVNDKIRTKGVKGYPYYSKYNEPLPTSNLPKFYINNKNFISTTPSYLSREHSKTNVNILNDYKTFSTKLYPEYVDKNFNTINYWPIHKYNKASNDPFKKSISKSVNYNYIRAPVQLQSNFTPFIPNLQQPTKIYHQPLDNTLGSYVHINMNPYINQYVKSDFPTASGVLSSTERLTPILSKNKLKNPSTSTLLLQPSMEFNQIRPQNFALPSSEPKYLLGQKSAEPSYNNMYKKIINTQPPWNVIEPNAQYAYSNSKVNMNLTGKPYNDALWFKKYQKNIPELFEFTKFDRSQKNKPVIKQNPYLLRPKKHRYNSKNHLSPVPQINTVSSLSPYQLTHNKIKSHEISPISSYLTPYKINQSDNTSDSIFKFPKHTLKSNVATLSRETDTSDVLSNKNLQFLAKPSQYRQWPQNILTTPIAGPIPNVKEYPLYSSPQVGTAKAFLIKSPIIPLSEVSSPPLSLYNKTIIQGSSPIPSYIKPYKVNISDVPFKSIKPIFNLTSPNTKDTAFNENIRLQTNSYISKPLQYHIWPHNVIPSLVLPTYMGKPESNQNLHLAKQNFDQYPLRRPYLSRKPQSVPASAFKITSLPVPIPAVKSIPHSPVSAVRNKPQYILTSPIISQHAAMPKINENVHLSKQKVKEYPSESYLTPKTVTKETFSIQPQFTPLLEDPSSSSLPLYKAVPKKPIIQDISLIPSYIKPFKQISDIPSSIFPISRQQFKSTPPQFYQKSPAITFLDTVCNKIFKLHTNPYVKKPLQYRYWPQYEVIPEKSQILYLPEQHYKLYPTKRFFLSKPKSVQVFPIRSIDPFIPAKSSLQSPTLAIRYWPQNILTSPISSQYVAMPKRNNSLPKENFNEYPLKSYSKPQVVGTNTFPIKSSILPLPEVSPFSLQPLSETVPSFIYIKPHKLNIFAIPQQPLNLITPNLDLVSPTITYTKPLAHYDWPQNIISSMASPYAVTLDGNPKKHPKPNINEFYLKYVSSAITAVKPSSRTLVSTSSLLPKFASQTSTLPMLLLPNSSSTFLPKAFSSSLQTSLRPSLPTSTFPTSLPITSPTLLPTSSLTSLPASLSYIPQPIISINKLPHQKYKTYRTKEINPLSREFSYDKFKVLPKNNYKTPSNSDLKLNTVPSTSPLTPIVSNTLSSKSKALSFNTISPSKQFSFMPKQTIPFAFTKSIDKKVRSATMITSIPTQPTYQYNPSLNPQQIPTPSLLLSHPSSYQYPPSHVVPLSNKFRPYHPTSRYFNFAKPTFNTDNINTKPINVSPKSLKQFRPINNYDYQKPQSIIMSTKIDSISPSPTNKLYLIPGSIKVNSHSAHLLPKKVFQRKTTPQISSYSNSLLAKENNLFPINNKLNYTNNEALPISKPILKPFTPYLKIPKKVSPNSDIYSFSNFLSPLSPINMAVKPNHYKHIAHPLETHTFVNNLKPHSLPATKLLPNSHPYLPFSTLNTKSFVPYFTFPKQSKSSQTIPIKFLTKPQYFHSQHWNAAPYSCHLPPLKTYSSHKPYTSFLPKMQDLKSLNSATPNDIIKKNPELSLISNFQPYKLDFSSASSSTQASSVKASEPSFSPLGQSILSKTSPSPFRPLSTLYKDQSTKLPTKWSLLKKPLILPFKSDVTSNHPNYESLQTSGTESSGRHLNLGNHPVIYTKPKNIFKSTHIHYNYPKLTQEQVNPEKKTSYKPYTSAHNVYPLEVQRVKIPTSYNPQPISTPTIPLKGNLLNIPHSKKSQASYQIPASVFTQLYQPNVIKPRPVYQSKTKNSFDYPPSSTLPIKMNLLKSPKRSNMDHFKPYYTYLTPKVPLEPPLHYNYDTFSIVDIQPSNAYKKLTNQFTWSQAMAHSSDEYKNNQPLIQQNQANFNKDVKNTQATFSQIPYLPAYLYYNDLSSLKTQNLYPSYKPYTSTNTIYPSQFSKTSKSFSTDKTTNINLPSQSRSTFVPFKSYISYKPYIQTPSHYQRERLGKSSPNTPSCQTICAKIGPDTQPYTISIPSTKFNLLPRPLAPVAQGSFKPSSFLPHAMLSPSSISLQDSGYKTLPILDTKTSTLPFNILNKTKWPQYTLKFTPKSIGKHQNYLSFISQDQSNNNNIKTQPTTITISKVTPKLNYLKSFNPIKSYLSYKPYISDNIFNELNFKTLRAPYLFNKVSTSNGNTLMKSQPIQPSQTNSPIPDYYQAKSPYKLAWTKTIPTGEYKDTSTLYNIQPQKLPTSWYLMKKSLTPGVDTLKPYLTSPTTSPSFETYPSRGNAAFLINKASENAEAFSNEKGSPYSLQSNLQAPSVPTFNGRSNKIKYFTSNTEIPNKTGKYNYVHYLQKKPLTNKELYSKILYKNKNYKKYYPTINRPTENLNALRDVYSYEDIRNEDRNRNKLKAVILNKHYKPNLHYQEISTNNVNLPYKRIQGTEPNRNGKLPPNINIFKYDPRDISKGIEIETDNPDIFIKAWTSRIEVIKPRIVYDKFKVNAINFEPIVKEVGKYDPNVLEDIVKSYVERYYGEPIVLKGTYNFYKPYIISNVKNECLKHGKVYIVWPTLCDCEKCFGCQCHKKLS